MLGASCLFVASASALYFMQGASSSAHLPQRKFKQHTQRIFRSSSERFLKPQSPNLKRYAGMSGLYESP